LEFRASIVMALMTLFIPGAGPPPTRMPSRWDRLLTSVISIPNLPRFIVTYHRKSGISENQLREKWGNVLRNPGNVPAFGPNIQNPDKFV